MAHSLKASSERMRHSRALKGGKAAANSPKRHYPLRSIVGSEPDPKYPSLTNDVLECGHRVMRARDLFGEVNRYKRRCEDCFNDSQKG
jgi:hypothetical protein